VQAANAFDKKRQRAQNRGFVRSLSLWNFCEKIAGILSPAPPKLPGMGRKRRRVVVTITETWTFVFDGVGEAPVSAPSCNSLALASIPASPPNATPPTDATAQESSSAPDCAV